MICNLIDWFSILMIAGRSNLKSSFILTTIFPISVFYSKPAKVGGVSSNIIVIK